MDIEQLDKLVFTLGDGSKPVLMLMLALMMFAVALGLKPSHFSFLKTDPKHYVTGVAAQIIGLPLLTLGLVYLVNPAPSIALGMILVSCCPGGNSSNLLSMFARGNTALSVSMTATSSLAAAFITPISILFWLSLYGPTRELLTHIDFDVISFLTQTLLILALPILMGMIVVRYAPKVAARLQKPLGLIGAAGMVAIVVLGFYQYRDLVPKVILLVFPLVIAHNALALALGYFTGRLTGADIPTRRALTFEIGIQNTALGFVILLTQITGLGGAAAITGMWGLWHFIGGGFMVWVFRTADKRKEMKYV
ncbi:MAG: bile acid:sodium symporter family protein [Robiginitomaculum sp.]|nr:bile acid:sodium symporter family protein [Robiginitomaculum sp.]